MIIEDHILSKSSQNFEIFSNFRQKIAKIAVKEQKWLARCGNQEFGQNGVQSLFIS